MTAPPRADTPPAAVHLCKAGVEAFLAGELALAGLKPAPPAQGSGMVVSDAPPGGWDAATPSGGLCFAWLTLIAPRQIRGASVNELRRALDAVFAAEAPSCRFDAPWLAHVEPAPGVDGLPGRAASLRKAWLDGLARRMPRVARLAADTPGAPPGRPSAGLAVRLEAFDSGLACARIVHWGQRRMRDADGAPSRSFLKIEEAYGILGAAPAPGERVADLGAAPGGWSFSAARRGAAVDAVDNGPLKGGAAAHPAVAAIHADAFSFRPAPGAGGYDWLFMDVLGNPYRSIETARRWLAGGWCRRFIVNLKYGRHDPVAVLAASRDPRTGLAPLCRSFAARHLLHDREEITAMGERL